MLSLSGSTNSTTTKLFQAVLATQSKQLVCVSSAKVGSQLLGYWRGGLVLRGKVTKDGQICREGSVVSRSAVRKPCSSLRPTILPSRLLPLYPDGVGPSKGFSRSEHMPQNYQKFASTGHHGATVLATPGESSVQVAERSRDFPQRLHGLGCSPPEQPISFSGDFPVTLLDTRRMDAGYQSGVICQAFRCREATNITDTSQDC